MLFSSSFRPIKRQIVFIPSKLTCLCWLQIFLPAATFHWIKLKMFTKITGNFHFLFEGASLKVCVCVCVCDRPSEQSPSSCSSQTQVRVCKPTFFYFLIASRLLFSKPGDWAVLLLLLLLPLGICGTPATKVTLTCVWTGQRGDGWLVGPGTWLRERGNFIENRKNNSVTWPQNDRTPGGRRL